MVFLFSLNDSPSLYLPLKVKILTEKTAVAKKCNSRKGVDSTSTSRQFKTIGSKGEVRQELFYLTVLFV
jgi:hypothetical protein